MCRTDNGTNFSVVVRKGGLDIGNARVDYPVYKKEDITVTYNQEWFPDKFCKRADVYLHEGGVDNGTILQLVLYQANQTTANIVRDVTVPFTVEDDKCITSGAKGCHFIALMHDIPWFHHRLNRKRDWKRK